MRSRTLEYSIFGPGIFNIQAWKQGAYKLKVKDLQLRDESKISYLSAYITSYSRAYLWVTNLVEYNPFSTITLRIAYRSSS